LLSSGVLCLFAGSIGEQVNFKKRETRPSSKEPLVKKGKQLLALRHDFRSAWHPVKINLNLFSVIYPSIKDIEENLLQNLLRVNLWLQC
jgi:hypothetical protein